MVVFDMIFGRVLFLVGSPAGRGQIDGVRSRLADGFCVELRAGAARLGSGVFFALSEVGAVVSKEYE
jgi:hypothetical protein